MQQNEARLKIFERALNDTNEKIAAERKKYEDGVRAQREKREEQARKEQEAKWRAYEQQQRERQAEKAAEQAKAWREEALRAAKEAREAQEAQERARLAREAELRQRQERTRMAREEAARQAQERARMAREAATKGGAGAWTSSSRSGGGPAKAQPGTCQHKAFWPKIDGRHICSNCHTRQNLFAFQCPGCKIIACAPCRQNLRDEKGGRKRNTNRRYSHWHNQDNEPDLEPDGWDNSYYDPFD